MSAADEGCIRRAVSRVGEGVTTNATRGGVYLYKYPNARAQGINETQLVANATLGNSLQVCATAW